MSAMPLITYLQYDGNHMRNFPFFLGIFYQCDTRAVPPGHRHLSESVDSDGINSALIESDEEEEEEDDEDLSYISRSTGYIRQVRKNERIRR